MWQPSQGATSGCAKAAIFLRVPQASRRTIGEKHVILHAPVQQEQLAREHSCVDAADMGHAVQAPLDAGRLGSPCAA